MGVSTSMHLHLQNLSWVPSVVFVDLDTEDVAEDIPKHGADVVREMFR